jgi:hypothetical protein
MVDPLQQLSQYGQAYWIDNLTRRMIKSGELYMRVTAHNLRGVTSNPAIFHMPVCSEDWRRLLFDPELTPVARLGLGAFQR